MTGNKSTALKGFPSPHKLCWSSTINGKVRVRGVRVKVEVKFMIRVSGRVEVRVRVKVTVRVKS